MSSRDRPSPALQTRVSALMGAAPRAWRHASGGYTTAERWIVSLGDGSTCFVKSGAGNLATFLRAEYEHVYANIEAPFLPRLLGWEDDGSAPILVLEDLSDAHWPPPWSPAHVGAVLRTLEALQDAETLGAYLPSLEDLHGDADFKGNWHEIERAPEAFLSLGLCTGRWLREALPALTQACTACRVDGEDILHCDVRSDNLCFRNGQAMLVDWNHACRGNRELDVAFWLPSLHSEGGQLPQDAYRLAPEWGAVVAGYFAARAGLPPVRQAPFVREVQLSQLRSALPWAVAVLDLPALDGPRAPPPWIS